MLAINLEQSPFLSSSTNFERKSVENVFERSKDPKKKRRGSFRNTSSPLKCSKEQYEGQKHEDANDNDDCGHNDKSEHEHIQEQRMTNVPGTNSSVHWKYPLWTRQSHHRAAPIPMYIADLTEKSH